jgi:protein ImuB
MAVGGRRLLAAVNPAAAAAGLAPGMALADALAFLPGLSTAAAEPAADRAALVRLAEWCARYSPWTAPDFQSGGGSDGVRIEITGCAHLWGGEERLAADLARRLARQGIAHRIAVAGTPGAAWALARFAAAPGRPALAPAGAERVALAPLPVEALRLDPATAAGLRRVGLRQIGALYAMPRAALARRFGAHGLENNVGRRLDQALGEEPEPLSPLGEVPARRVRLSFAEPIADPADLARAARRLAEDAAARLLREGMGARRLDLAFHRLDGRVEHIAVGTARPSRDPQHLAALLLAKLETVDPGLGVEDMIFAVFVAEKLAAEQTAFAGGCGAMTDGMAPLLDRLGARLGHAAPGRIAARQSHIPERAAVFVPVGEEPGNAGLWTKPPRPVRLFRPPEPITAAWLLPDDPPFRFTWRRRPYRVCRADGPERIAAEWWTAEAAASGEAIRDYYRVEDEEGRRFWLFRAGLPGFDEKGEAPRWFLHGVFA